MHVCDLYRQRGYHVEPQRGVGDWGVDLFATKGSERVAVQVKMYGHTSRPVNRAMMMELEGARRFFDCTGAALVTNGRVLPDAQRVADKLGIPITQLASDGVVPAPSAPSGELHFDDLWSEHVMPLQGKFIESSRGPIHVVNVDWSGIKQVSSTGNTRFIPIESFRNVVNRLLQTGVMTREEINADNVGRVSSAVCLILSQVPGIRYGGKPGVLRYKAPAASAPQKLSPQPTIVPDASGGPIAESATTDGDVVSDALRALAPPGLPLDDPRLQENDGAGLYAVYGPPEVWVELGLGTPPDERPLYVGKAEESLVSRDVRQHFRTGSTGSSTLRRSLAALLQERLGTRAQPRNPKKPDHFSNYSIDAASDQLLSEWMHNNLRLAMWRRPGDEPLRRIEEAVLQHWLPPLNSQGVKTPWSSLLSQARARMAGEARRWTGP
jgi:hypothetical protein